MLWYVCIYSCSIYMYVCIERNCESGMARDDGRDGTQDEGGRERQEDSLSKDVRCSGYLECFLVSLYQ